MLSVQYLVLNAAPQVPSCPKSPSHSAFFYTVVLQMYVLYGTVYLQR